jgi:RNA polymerase sigma-70 factor (ECF subfamily)
MKEDQHPDRRLRVTAEAAFTEFVGRVEPRLRAALVAGYGAERGWEATAEALAYAWEHWDDMDRIEHPVAYLYRVGQSKTRPRRRPNVRFSPPRSDPPWVEPALPAALERLSRHQRMAVVLVHAMGWTQGEAAEVMGVATGTVKTHLDRGLAKLRAALEVDADV